MRRARWTREPGRELSLTVSDAPEFRVVEARCFERDVRLRLPFRFGSATVTHAPQAFVRVRLRLTDGREAVGAAAELMIPKWFDKSPDKTNDDNIEDLRRALLDARDAYTSEHVCTSAFAHCVNQYGPLQESGATANRPALVTSFGGALLDRALLDALCRALGVSFAAAINANLPGMTGRLTNALAPDLDGFDIAGFLRKCAMPDGVWARHTVGMLDPLVLAEATSGPADGLPVALTDVITRYGHRYFKLKLRGEPQADIERLACIAAVLDPLPGYAVTLDGNEQFRDAAAVGEFVAVLHSDARLTRLAKETLYLEQLLPRDLTFDTDMAEVARVMPLLIDESDATYAAFPAARARGYTGVSSKSCKGIYKSFANAMRCALWNAQSDSTRYFLSGEDLTTQAGLAMQQDLALAALLGITHVERNGHHYVNGFTGQGASAPEQEAFRVAHPDLYEGAPGTVRVRLSGGRLPLASFDAPGFAASAMPDFAAMTPMAMQQRVAELNE
jgi:L-alanine-DL-glutamate epimerase-like enolase superfamily enzyme